MDSPPTGDRDERDEGTRPDTLRLRLPWTDHREVDQVSAALAVGALGMGPRTVEFEARFAALVGARYAVAVNSCWAGFHLALEALAVAPGDEVVTSVACGTPAIAAISHLGATPVLIDVVPGTLTLDAAQIERRITPRTRVILPAHFGGCPAGMEQILALAARHRLHVVEDAIHALPTIYHGRMIGSIGDLTVFGLSPDLVITTGEGGIVTTDRDELARLLRTRRFYGIPEDRAQPRQPPERARYEETRTYGFGYQMSDLNAAVGLEQVQKVPMFHAIRSYYAGLYEIGLSDLRELVLPTVPPGVQHAWALYVIQLRRDRLRIGREAFIRLLAHQNIAAGVHFVPLYAHAYYRERFGLEPDDFPVAHEAHDTSISLPLYPRMSEADVWCVIGAIRRIVAMHATS